MLGADSKTPFDTSEEERPVSTTSGDPGNEGLTVLRRLWPWSGS
jgi:hypothetical protein